MRFSDAKGEEAGSKVPPALRKPGSDFLVAVPHRLRYHLLNYVSS